MTAESRFVEPGALKSNGEFKRWIHVKRKSDPRVAAVYPYPLDKPYIDADLIVAHWLMARMRNWHSSWTFMNKDFYVLRLGHNRLLWRLARGVHDDSAGSDYQPVPQGVLDAFT